MNIEKWIKSNCRSLKGKKVVVTGATGGLGRELCFLLAELNADMIFACRNKSNSEKLIFEIKEKYPFVNIDFVELDFSKKSSVDLCIKVLQKYDGIDILINNAGVYNVPLKKLDSGFNNIFQINFLYVYYFTKKLLPLLEKKKDSVCVTVGSVAHNYSRLDEKDIDFSSRKKASKIYGNAKRFLMFSFYELFKNSKVRLSIVHPGITLTNMTSHYPKTINWIVKLAVGLVFPKPKIAALNLLYGVFDETKTGEWIGPKTFNVWGRPKKQKLKSVTQDEVEKIYKIAENIENNLT